MTEILTESFCERCGTRYDLGSTEPMTTARKTRGLVSGLRQFIMSDTESLQDSIDDAMRAQEEALAARQVDAFQETFSFCFDCRRYTCTSCWNDEAGRCRSCKPVDGIDDVAGYDQRVGMPALFPEPVDETPLLTTAEEPAWPAAEPVAPALAWPSEDEIVPPVAAEVEPVEVEPLAAEVEIPEPVAAEAEPVEEPIAAEAEPEVELEASLAAEVEIPEPLAAEAEPAEVEAIEAPIAAPEPVEPMEEPIAASVESEPEPEAPAAPPPPIAAPRRDLRDTFLRGPIVARPAPTPAEQLPESLAARRSQLDTLGIDDPGEGTVSVGQREALPYRSSGAGSAAGAAALAAVWDASTRALEAGAGPQRATLRPCGACGLTVSSTARFCRRCGAPQTLSA